VILTSGNSRNCYLPPKKQKQKSSIVDSTTGKGLKWRRANAKWDGIRWVRIGTAWVRLVFAMGLRVDLRRLLWLIFLCRAPQSCFMTPSKWKLMGGKMGGEVKIMMGDFSLASLFRLICSGANLMTLSWFRFSFLSASPSTFSRPLFVF